jgi:hypothetical protein
MPRFQRTYDHRLVRLVQDTGDITIATGVGVPRSTAAGWLRRARRDVTTGSTCETSSVDLRARLARTEARLCCHMPGPPARPVRGAAYRAA